MPADDEDHLGAQFFHGTRVDLTGETHVLPRAETKRRANWTDMDPSERSQVFMVRSPESALNWAAETSGRGKLRVYEVEPEGDIDERSHTVAASRARIIREHPVGER